MKPVYDNVLKGFEVLYTQGEYDEYGNYKIVDRKITINLPDYSVNVEEVETY